MSLGASIVTLPGEERDMDKARIGRIRDEAQRIDRSLQEKAREFDAAEKNVPVFGAFLGEVIGELMNLANAVTALAEELAEPPNNR